MIVLVAALILSTPATGDPTTTEAMHMAEAFVRCVNRPTTPPDFDAPLLVSLASFESGFRPGAIRDVDPGKAPRMVGLFQLNEKYLPARMKKVWRDVDAHVDYWCGDMVPKWASYHARYCKRPGRTKHPLLAHHFSGYVITRKAITAALSVIDRAEDLRARLR